MHRLARAACAAALMVFCAGCSGSAGGDKDTATTEGSAVTFSADGDVFTICDTQDDGDPVYVKLSYKGSGSGIRLRNDDGPGGAGDGCVERAYDIGEGTKVSFESCEADSLFDTCSDEITGTA
jgi:hypothetical protein